MMTVSLGIHVPGGDLLLATEVTVSGKTQEELAQDIVRVLAEHYGKEAVAPPVR